MGGGEWGVRRRRQDAAFFFLLFSLHLPAGRLFRAEALWPGDGRALRGRRSRRGLVWIGRPEGGKEGETQVKGAAAMVPA